MPNAAQRTAADRAKYPGMQVDEVLVWKAFLAAYGSQYDRFDYNTRLGAGSDPGPAVMEPYRSMSIKLSQFRIDAVGWQGGAPTIFEVERYAQPRNVGQVLTYRNAWQAQAASSVDPALAIVAASYNPNIQPTLDEHQITLYILPIDFSTLAPARVRS
jgi:hypothetical protein